MSKIGRWLTLPEATDLVAFLATDPLLLLMVRGFGKASW